MRRLIKWIFILVGILFGAVVGLGVYFVFGLKPSNEDSKLSESALLAVEALPRQLHGHIVIPPSLLAEFPVSRKLGARLEKVGKEGGEEYVPILKLRSVTSKDGTNFVVQSLDVLYPGIYNLRIFVCKPDVKECTEGNQGMQGMTLFRRSELNSDQPTSVGEININRRWPPKKECPAGAKLISGNIVATPDFLKTLAPGKKLALGVFSFYGTARMFKLGLASKEADAKALAANKVPPAFWFGEGPISKSLLHSQFIEPKAEGTSFTVNLDAFQGSNPLLLAVVECESKEDHKACAERAFPLPVDSTSDPGRVYALRAKGYKLSQCGDTGVEYILHRFPEKGATASSQGSNLPEEARY